MIKQPCSPGRDGVYIDTTQHYIEYFLTTSLPYPAVSSHSPFISRNLFLLLVVGLAHKRNQTTKPVGILPIWRKRLLDHQRGQHWISQLAWQLYRPLLSLLVSDLPSVCWRKLAADVTSCWVLGTDLLIVSLLLFNQSSLTPAPCRAGSVS